MNTVFLLLYIAYNKSTKKIQDLAENQTQDLLNTSQTLLPWTSGRGVEVHVNMSSPPKHTPIIGSYTLIRAVASCSLEACPAHT